MRVQCDDRNERICKAMTKIEWTDATWNPVAGCTWASPGCDVCYAARMTRRLEAMGQADYAGLTTKKHFNGTVRTLAHKLDAPLRWKKPRMVFVNSMSDLFHKDVPTEFIWQVFDTMWNARQHTFQILTKRPERMAGVLSEMYAASCSDPLPNVWLGTSVENVEQTARIDHLLKCPAAVRFISAEPLLECVDFAFRNWADEEKYRIDWCIVGGESGPGARPMHPDWARLIRDDCQAAGVKFFMKQMDKKQPIPVDLLIREFPDGLQKHPWSKSQYHRRRKQAAGYAAILPRC